MEKVRGFENVTGSTVKLPNDIVVKTKRTGGFGSTGTR